MNYQNSGPELTAVTEFVRQCLPFNHLPDQSINTLIDQLQIAYFCRGHTFHAGSQDDGLRIVRSGAVEVRGDNEILLDRLGEGESFNITGLSEGQPDIKAVVIEDSLIYLLRENHYLQLRRDYRNFDRFFHSQRSRRLRRAVRYNPNPNPMMRLVKNLMSKNVLSVSRTDTIKATAQLMSDQRVSSVLVVDKQVLHGIVTDRDLRSRALAKGLDHQTSVYQVMTTQPLSINHDATLFDATLLMAQQGYHHLPVVEQGKTIGIITASDLMLARQDDPVYLVQHISRQLNVEGIKSVMQSLPTLLVEWVNIGMQSNQISHIFTAISDAVTTRLIELAIEKLGASPVPFCWLAFGSQARAEQLIGADQDNGLIISDDLTDQDKAWFEQFTGFVCDGLNTCGYVYCPGGVMAVTPRWCQSLSGWCKTVDRWTQSPTPEAVMHVSIFFDLRAIYGDKSLCQHLQTHMLKRSSQNSIFLAALAANVLLHKPPLGLFRRFLVERNGEHRDSLDLKKSGVIPIVDMVRIYALTHKIVAVNTQERIAELARKKALTLTDSRNLQDAFDFIMQLRVQGQAGQLGRGEPVSNYCRPRDLAQISGKHLRDVFTVVHDYQEALRQTYRHGV